MDATITSGKEKIRELCRLMHLGGLQIVVHDRRRGLRILWNDTFVSKHRDETSRIQDLVYRDEDLTGMLALLEDGMYGPVELWNFFYSNTGRT